MQPQKSPSILSGLGVSRRNFISQCASGVLLYMSGAAVASELYTKPGALAEELTRTVSVEEGPFYPYHKLPLDTDNDLLIVNDAITPAIGEITHISGRLLDAKGQPVRNATIEIWQVDHNAVYLAERGSNKRL